LKEHSDGDKLDIFDIFTWTHLHNYYDDIWWWWY